jgi:hypothetical protein
MAATPVHNEKPANKFKPCGQEDAWEERSRVHSCGVPATATAPVHNEKSANKFKPRGREDAWEERTGGEKPRPPSCCVS